MHNNFPTNILLKILVTIPPGMPWNSWDCLGIPGIALEFSISNFARKEQPLLFATVFQENLELLRFSNDYIRILLGN